MLREDGRDVVLGDELLLVDAFHELAAQAVDGFALLVHDVVVFEHVFAGFEVLGFDGLLRGFDAAARSCALSIGTPSSMPRRCSRVETHSPREDAHQVVFEREIEARGAGIALAAGAAAKLVVDAAGFVPLGAEDVQAAGGDDFVVLGFGCGLVRGDGAVPGCLRGLELLALVVEAHHAGTGDGLDRSFGSGDGAGHALA